jgi:hypothetical protein
MIFLRAKPAIKVITDFGAVNVTTDLNPFERDEVGGLSSEQYRDW